VSKLELGSGQRPTAGYEHNDVNNFPGVDHVGPAWTVPAKADSYDEVLALGTIEHLTYAQVRATVAHVHEILTPGGVFLFDVPDIAVWCRYLIDGTDLFTPEHVRATIYGWQRWPGDEHKSGWTRDLLAEELSIFSEVRFGVEEFTSRGHVRNRMSREGDAHIYVAAFK
jgi:predicted SAM-dependent methyltransferase